MHLSNKSWTARALSLRVDMAATRDGELECVGKDRKVK